MPDGKRGHMRKESRQSFKVVETAGTSLKLGEGISAQGQRA